MEKLEIDRDEFRAILEALTDADNYFISRDNMNSCIHLAPTRLSPITEKIANALKLANRIWEE